MPTWAAVSKTHVFRTRNLLLKWRRKATATDARQPKITQWHSTAGRERDSAREAAGRPTAQQAKAEARASRARRRVQSAGRTASLQNTRRQWRWVRGAPNGTNDADQTPPENDLLPEPGALGATPGASADDTTTGTGPAAAAHGAADFGIDLGWLPEPGRTQAMSGRAAAHDDIRRCAYHLAPLGCALVDGDADGPGLVELYGRKPESQSVGTPEVRAGSPTQPTDPRPSDAPNAAEPSTEVCKRSANLMAWCERCAFGIHFYCANDHALGHSGDGHIGNYGAKDIATKSVLDHGCWSTYKPYVDESDEEEIEGDTNPERHPTASDGDGPAA